ncbi:hypothetical protein DERP_005540 [Dermatophagoides pteronyssinus]|uniref:Uncharacterized protein n=1 Tax=Dermatophagoides pteronyssinus TaxID=6956 RepID=A0ABQ8JNM2_DERPT|nr:hypothetical protein DERP_005540 [Dermatophagoides pteronyssinus]
MEEVNFCYIHFASNSIFEKNFYWKNTMLTGTEPKKKPVNLCTLFTL